MAIRYYLKSQAAAAPAIVITDSTGRDVAKLQGASTPGINTVVWTMRPQNEGRGGRGAAVAPTRSSRSRRSATTRSRCRSARRS